MRFKYFILVTLFLIGTAYFSMWSSNFYRHNDFSAYYRAANIVRDTDKQITDVYKISAEDASKYNIPKEEGISDYRYSIMVSYLITPLAFFNFETADAILIFVNIIAYVTSLILILRHFCSKKTMIYLYLLVFLVYWMPFRQNIIWNQVNAILLLLITFALYLAINKHHWAAGISLAIASLFKPYVIPITMVISLKNWRLAPAFLGVIAFNILCLPGAAQWFHASLWPPHHSSCFSFIYQYLQQFGNYQFWIYAVIIGATTAIAVWFNKETDYFTLLSLAIPASFLAMPLLQSHYPTVLIFTFAFLSTQDLSLGMTVSTIISFLLISISSKYLFTGSFFNASLAMYLGIFIIWIVMLMKLTQSRTNNLGKALL